MRDRVVRWCRAALVIGLCLLGAVLAVNTFGRAEFDGGGLTFSTQISLFARGETRLSLPPLGVASARTHRAPLRIQLELRGLNPALLHDFGSDPAFRDKVLADTEARARLAMLRTSVMAILLAGLGSLAVAVLLRKHAAKALIGAFIMGGTLCGILLGWTYTDYDADALRQPRYEGMLESAPWIMSILTNSLDGLARLGQGFEVMAENLPRLTRQAQAGAPMSDVGEDLRVMHVSDIHNNKAAFELIAALVQNFAVDVVIDTGDLTDLGTPFEAAVADNIARLKVPYVFVAGNHESPEVVARLRRIRNVHVLGDRMVKIKGLRILGTPDPASVVMSAEVATGDALQRAGEDLASRWRESVVKPEIVAAHNHKVLEPLFGLVQVVLHGHDHRASLTRIKGTFVEDAGTTGAAGFRGLASKQDVPMTVDLQYWRKDEAGRLVLAAVDAIAFDSLNGSLHVARTALFAGEASSGPARETAAREGS